MPRRIVRPLEQFLHAEISGGLVLLAATVVALLWANLWTAAYLDVWSTEITVEVAGLSITENLRYVVNDGLMTVFFLVIGLEVKRELAVGELSTRQAALLPAFAAIGGMLVPALVFLAVTAGGEGASGWGIPMATDVAFALGALAALGRRVPAALIAFLLGVAVIDDIGAILVVALVYSDTPSLPWILVAVAGLAAMAVLHRLCVRHLAPYVALGLVVWFATFESGVHATIAGVAIGLLTPAHPFQPASAVGAEAVRIAGEIVEDPVADTPRWRRLAWLSREAMSPLTRVEHGLHLWSSFLVLPVFALANAGILLDGASIRAATETPVALAVGLGLVVGKPLGLLLGAALAVGLGLSRLPAGVRWVHVAGVGALAGIGFTVALFITGLAYTEPAIADGAKLGVLVGSVLAAGLGLALLGRGRGARRDPAGAVETAS